MTAAIRSATAAPLPSGELLIDEQGNVYGGSGTPIQALQRLVRKDELDLKAASASPALTGVPTVPTAAAGTATTQIASTGFVAAAITALVGAAPAALDTLVEIAAQIQADEGAAAALAAAIGNRLPLVQPNTVYSAGTLAVNPSGQIVSANTGFTFGATYDPSAWTVTSGYDGGTNY